MKALASNLGSRLTLQAALAAMPTPTLGKVPTRVLVTTTPLACLVSVRLVLLGLVIPEPLLVTPGQTVPPPPGLVVTLAPPLVTLAVTRGRLVIPARVATRAAAPIRALAMDQDLMAPQTSMSTSLALFPCAPCLLATSTRAHLRQLKLMRAPCLVLPLPC
ncbi:hypothetical protein HMPREF1978_00029 [Actinomyces graevenitzii F0530]|uniref:Uncharacterized protein n=1 Tax=Actinomyces graevenitzii F0530 TaxID=1321817 RepID=U1RMA9_9ACTO|nr:hypothetical protein HMPREF1978_00029 [Actinomyces graevenitzii F0530]